VNTLHAAGVVTDVVPNLYPAVLAELWPRRDTNCASFMSSRTSTGTSSTPAPTAPETGAVNAGASAGVGYNQPQKRTRAGAPNQEGPGPLHLENIGT